MQTLEVVRKEVSAMTVEQMERELANCLRLTAEGMLRSAVLVQALIEAGRDVSALRVGGTLHWLRHIAEGRLLPEVPVKFAHSSRVIMMIGNLPLSEQERFVRGEPLRLLVIDHNEKQDWRMVNPFLMTNQQARQLVAENHLRDETEQLHYLNDLRMSTRRKVKKGAKIGTLTLDPERGGVVHRGEFIPSTDIKKALGLLKLSAR